MSALLALCLLAAAYRLVADSCTRESTPSAPVTLWAERPSM